MIDWKFCLHPRQDIGYDCHNYFKKQPLAQPKHRIKPLIHARKKRFGAGQLTGDFPVEIDALDSAMETLIVVVGKLMRELNQYYCLNLPERPSSIVAGRHHC